MRLIRRVIAIVTSFVLAFSMEAQSQSCGYCLSHTFDGSFFYHFFPGELRFLGWTPPWHEDWLFNKCEEVHLQCIGDETLDAVSAAVQHSDVQTLRGLLLTGQAQFNRTRSAIQVLGCGGEIAAHFSIDRRVAGALNESYSVDFLRLRTLEDLRSGTVFAAASTFARAKG
jgi:hypothetical protein